MKAKSIINIILVIVFFYLFLIYEPGFRGPDEPIYFAYTASIVEDGDLNVVNNIDPHNAYYFPLGKINVSKTYNLPDFHNYGGVILWVPFYVYAKGFYSLVQKMNLKCLITYGFDKFVNCAMSFSTVIFGFITLIFSYFLCKVFFTNKIALWSTVALFLATPFFYYMLFEVANANIIASMFSILSIWFCSYIINMKKSQWFWYGLFFSICIIIKTDLWFQFIFILSLFAILLILKKTSWVNIVYFILGVIPGLTLKIINDYIKYGTLHMGESGILNFRDFYFIEQLFSSYRGFFYTSPIFYICLSGLILSVAALLRNNTIKNEKKLQELFFIILALYLIIKIFIFSFRYAWGGGSAGARQLLTEFPVFVLLYARVIQSKRRFFRYIIVIISVIFIFWNLLVVSEFMAGLDFKYVTGFPKLSARIKNLNYLFNTLFCIKDLNFKLKFCLPLLLVVFWTVFYIVKKLSTESIPPSFWYIRDLNNRKCFKKFIFFAIFLFTTYTIITTLNIYNNKRNVKRLKADGFFENAKIIGPAEFEKEENIGSMNEMIEYFTLKGDIERVNKIKKYKKEIYGENGYI